MKCFDVLKAAVNRREAHVTHFIQVPPLLHDPLADGSRGYLAFAQAPQLVANPRDSGLDRLPADRALLQRLLHSRQELALIEGLAAAVALDHGRHQQLRGLEGGEAFGTGETFASSTNLPALTGQAGVDDLSLRMAAKWAIHGACLARRRRAPARYQP